MFKKLAVFLITLSLCPVAAMAATPKDFAENLADKAIAIVESKKDDNAKQDDLISLFRQNVDTDFMAKFTMGKYFRQLTPEQKNKYLGLYRDYVIYSYIPKFRQYTGERMVVNQTIKDDDDLFTVKTTLNTKASSTGSVLVDYKLKQEGGAFKIVDVIGEGVSLITTQRSDFSTPLADQGVDAFLAKLEDKVKALKSNPPTKIKGTAAVEKISKKDKQKGEKKVEDVAAAK